jgi:hypothetical protein
MLLHGRADSQPDLPALFDLLEIETSAR